MIKKIIKKIFNLTGLRIQKCEFYSHNTMLGGLYRSKLRGINPKTIIDVGAAQGKWSLEARNIWKNANVILFEPLLERQKELDNLVKLYKNFYAIKAGAGDKRGIVEFFVTKDLDGSSMFDNNSENSKRTINITTIDYEIDNLQLDAPYLIKLDTHVLKYLLRVQKRH